MGNRQVKSRRRQYVVWAVVAVVTGYFGYHTTYGRHGILSMQDLELRHGELVAKRDRLLEEKAFLEHRVSLLRPESLDPDMLDERARLLLNQARKDEVVITIGRP